MKEQAEGNQGKPHMDAMLSRWLDSTSSQKEGNWPKAGAELKSFEIEELDEEETDFLNRLRREVNFLVSLSSIILLHLLNS